MLTRLESLLEAPLRAALGATASLVFTAGDKPPDDQTPQLALLVTRLSRAPSATGSEDQVSREPAYAATTLLLHADAADPRLFALPAGAAGKVAEVQSPPGRLLAQADAWIADASGLRLLQVPAAPVRATLRGAQVLGYQERWAAQVELGLVAWAAKPDAASELLGKGLSAVLGTLFQLDLVDLQEAPAAGGLSLRLLKPVAQLLDIDRRVDTSGATAWQRLAARVQVQGELEQGLSLGVADPASTIRRIDFGLDRLRADGTQGHDAGTIGG